MHQLKIANHIALPLGVFFCLVLTANVYAQIVTDGSVGNPKNLGRVQNLPGPNFSIPESLGSPAGANLFHSFQDFNIQTGQSATFTGSNAIANVISRVTGGNPSNINGLLESTIGQADFYFLNPAGVMFGANARVDVPAAFHVSTANELRFADGLVYSANLQAPSNFSSASPEAFGFLGNQTGTISVVGSEITLDPGHKLSLSGGELKIEQAELSIDRGNIQLVAMGDAATILTIGGDPFEPAQGKLAISNSKIDVSGNGAGRVAIQGGVSEINSSSILADNKGPNNAGIETGIDIDATSLNIENSIVKTDAKGVGHAADLSVTVKDELVINNGVVIGSRTFAAGNAGSATFKVGNLNLAQSAAISTSTLSTGQGGNITIVANKDVTMSGRALIRTDASGSGNAGTIDLDVDTLSVSGGAQIFSGTFPNSTGHGGKITIVANKDVTASGAFIRSDTSGEGNSGTIDLDVGTLSVSARAQIFSGTLRNSKGQGGKITIVAKQDVTVSGGAFIRTSTSGEGNAGTIDLDVDTLSVTNGAAIFTNAFRSSTGQAGPIAIKATDKVTIAGTSSGLFTATSSSGNAGAINLQVGQLDLKDGAQIDSGARTGNTGQGGEIKIVANKNVTASGKSNTVSITSGGEIISGTFSTGNAGQVSVTSGMLTIDDQGSNFFTGISSSTSSDGNAGVVTVTVDGAVSIVNSGRITSATLAVEGEGDAGQVNLTAGTLTINGQESNTFTGIASSTVSGGNAGVVTVTVDGAVSIVNSGAISSATSYAEGDAGQVNLSAGTLMIDGKGNNAFTGITSLSLAGIANSDSTGDAGIVTVTVHGPVSIVSGGAISSSTFTRGDAEEVRVSAGMLTVDGQGSRIASVAGSDSSGQAGNITLNTNNLSIANGGTISIESQPTVDNVTLANIKPTEINITAQNLTLIDASISTESFGNVPAGSITLNIADTLSLDPSIITTAANNADGGSISINAKVIDLEDSRITTSVTGQGNGGDINLTSNFLILYSGFIQANTARANTEGGNIRINTGALIASQNQLFLGGNSPIPFQPGINVIQAASPDGVSGSVTITSPDLDIVGDLAGLEGELLDIGKLAQNSCTTPGGRQSSLASVGRGGLPESPESAISVVLDAERLKKLLRPGENLVAAEHPIEEEAGTPPLTVKQKQY